jgi:hypothetical protein
MAYTPLAATFVSGQVYRKLEFCPWFAEFEYTGTLIPGTAQ